MVAEEVDQHYMNPSHYYVTSYCSWHGHQFIRWVMWEITYIYIYLGKYRPAGKCHSREFKSMQLTQNDRYSMARKYF